MKKIISFIYSMLFVQLLLISCTFINNGSYSNIVEITEKILESDDDLGVVNVYIKDNKELKSLCEVLKLKNNSSFRIGLNLINSDFNNVYDYFSEINCITSIILPRKTLNIADNAFKGCTNLVSIKLGEDVKEIGNYSFYNCEKLKKIEFTSNNCSSIGYGAFAHCKALPSINITSSIRSIGKNAFLDCNSLFFSVEGNNKWVTDNNKEIILDNYDSTLNEFNLKRK